MFVLGLGLGCVMQVLVLAVQNAVEYKDLGIATSGATLFRSIGGSVGTSILGTIFANRLRSELASLFPAGADRAASGSAGLSSAEIHRLPPVLHADYLQAFTNSLSTVFEVAAAVGVVAFVLSWVLPEKPLRETATASTGVGEAFATPRSVNSEAEAMRALSVLLGRDKRRTLVANLAARAGVDLSPAACWLLVRLYEDPTVDIPATGRAFEIDESVTDEARRELAARAYATRRPTAGRHRRRTSGRRATDRRAPRVVGATRRGLADRQHPDLAGPDSPRAELEPDRVSAIATGAWRPAAGWRMRRPDGRAAAARLPRLDGRAAPSSLDDVVRGRHPRRDAGRTRRTLDQEERHVQRRRGRPAPLAIGTELPKPRHVPDFDADRLARQAVSARPTRTASGSCWRRR